MNISNPYRFGVPLIIEGLVSSYNMEAIPVIDDYGLNHENASTGTVITTGKINNGVLYNNGGTDIASNNLKLNNGSLECWFKTSNAGASYRGLIVKFQSYNIFLIDNYLGFYSYGNNSKKQSNILVNDNLWHYVVLTFQDGIVNGTKLYLDGSLILTDTLTIQNQNSNLFIGAASASTQKILSTSVDIVRIWETILTPEYISNNYANPVQIKK